MNRYPLNQVSGQLPARNQLPTHSNIPPPPLPPWAQQPNVPPPPIPPQTVPQRFISPQFLQNPPMFPPNTQQYFRNPPQFPPNTQYRPNPPFSLPNPQYRCLPNPPQNSAQTFHTSSTLHLSSSLTSPMSQVDVQKVHPLLHNTEIHEEPEKSEAQKQLEYFLQSRQPHSGPKTVKKRSQMIDIKIHSIKEMLNQAFNLMKELENGARTLSVMAKTVTVAEWGQKCAEIEDKKDKLTKVLNSLDMSEEEVQAFKAKNLKRCKKRQRVKRQKERWKKEKAEEEVRIKNKHVQIDNWQKKMQEDVDKMHFEEELQKEADAVLWGVREKTAEARRQVAVLAALLELRRVRAQRLSAAGKPVSQLQITTFNTVIERLKMMWSRHLDDCLLEEQALRGMLGKAELVDDPVKTHKRLVLQEWETAIFGITGFLDNPLKGDKLVNIRRSWDQFAVPLGSVLSFPLPPGWVLPVPPSSDQWHPLLKY